MARRKLITCDCCGKEIVGNFLCMKTSYEFIDTNITYTVESTAMKDKGRQFDICLLCEKEILKLIKQ